MDAHYAFGVRIRLEPDAADVVIESPTVERRCLLEAARPGTDGWLFFRDTLWRGEVSDEAYARRLLSEKLGLTVEAVDFRGLHTDEEYLEALKAEIDDSLETFNADSVTETMSKYFGSSLVVDGGNRG
ncbi:LWR-salt protein [Natronoglomus mannanivorans]|uniref:LWR-salt protein n=1 Tax=Natronoglomus mannanivorans TaxID=2979990 RepID=A0AAP2Z1M9_9EURY|nr:LWR-salt protein [Halobacteria archaeon AArc-xg1-1]